MTTETKGMHTPGAMRAGYEISARFRKALPNLPESNASTLAAIIDRETHAGEMLEACTRALTQLNDLDMAVFDLVESCRNGSWDSSEVIVQMANAADVMRGLKAAIAKAKGGQ
jgi:hypothetical protein